MTIRDEVEWRVIKLRQWPFMRWSELDDYCHKHRWVPRSIARRICDHFE